MDFIIDSSLSGGGFVLDERGNMAATLSSALWVAGATPVLVLDAFRWAECHKRGLFNARLAAVDLALLTAMLVGLGVLMSVLPGLLTPIGSRLR